MALLVHKLNVKLWNNTPFFKVGIFLIWSVFLAALFDFIENIGLIKLLMGDLKQFWVSLAYYFSMAKFSILLIVLSYILVNFSIFLFRKYR